MIDPRGADAVHLGVFGFRNQNGGRPPAQNSGFNFHRSSGRFNHDSRRPKRCLGRFDIAAVVLRADRK